MTERWADDTAIDFAGGRAFVDGGARALGRRRQPDGEGCRLDASAMRAIAGGEYP